MSAARQKGTAAETAVVGYLQAHGHPYAERRAGNGNQDRGDIAGVPGVVVEVKNCKTMDLAGWVDEATIEARNAGVPIGVVVHHRKGKGAGNVGEWYATMTLATLVELLA